MNSSDPLMAAADWLAGLWDQPLLAVHVSVKATTPFGVAATHDNSTRKWKGWCPNFSVLHKEVVAVDAHQQGCAITEKQKARWVQMGKHQQF